jgi:hypothetical protein
LEFNQKRRQYGGFRRRGYFIGSGVSEAGGKSLLGQGWKLSGMYWSGVGVDNVLERHCLPARGGCWDQSWENRREQKDARLAIAA